MTHKITERAGADLHPEPRFEDLLREMAVARDRIRNLPTLTNKVLHPARGLTAQSRKVKLAVTD